MMTQVKQLQNKAVSIDLCINDNTWQLPLTSLKILETVTYILQQLETGGNSVELSVVLTNDKEVQKLNAQYRHKDKPTNVLSFPANTPAVDGILPLGDIVVSYDTLVHESAEQGKTFNDHFTHLLMHGVLHLLGFDHETAQDAEYMENLEIAMLAHFGIESPYNN